MKKLLLVALGCTPFAVGWVCEVLLGSGLVTGLLWLYGPLFLLYWGWLGYLTCGFGRGRAVVALAHLPAALVMLANLLQTMVFGRFYSVWTQIFFTPLLFLTVNITGCFPYTTTVLREDSVVAVLLMIAAFCLGRRFARGR